MNIIDRFRSALENGEIWPAYQPVVNMETNAIAGFEVLARWTDRELGEVSPTVFIPMAEHSGLIDQLSSYLIFRACQEASNWGDHFILAFNIAPIQLKSVGIFDLIVGAVASGGFPLKRVMIEITESSLIADEVLSHRTIDQLREAGVAISLDDFGTGHSSLTRLNAYPFDKLKIDASFVRVMDRDPRSFKIVSAIVGLAHSFNIPVIAEGTETEAQAAMLMHLGCTFSQGWLYGKAVSWDEARLILEERGEEGGASITLDRSPFQRLYQLEALYNSAPLGVCFIDPDMNYVSLNERFAKIHRHTVESMLGCRVQDVYPGSQVDTVINNLKRALANEKVAPYEFQIEGCPSIYIVSIQRVDDDMGQVVGISVTMTDISERRAAELALGRHECFLAQASSQVPFAVWIAAGDGAMLYTSPIPGLVPGDISGTPSQRLEQLYSRIHPDDLVHFKSLWKRARRTKEGFHATVRAYWMDKTWHRLHVVVRPWTDSHHNIMHWFGLFFPESDAEALGIEKTIALLTD